MKLNSLPNGRLTKFRKYFAVVQPNRSTYSTHTHSFLDNLFYLLNQIIVLLK